MSNTIILVVVISAAIILTIIALIIVLKKPKPKSITTKEEFVFFDDLMQIVKNPNSTKDDLLESLKLFNEYFHIDEVNAQKYLIFLSKALTHPNVDKDIFAYFHKYIKTKNPKFKKELETIELKALG